MLLKKSLIMEVVRFCGSFIRIHSFFAIFSDSLFYFGEREIAQLLLHYPNAHNGQAGPD